MKLSLIFELLLIFILLAFAASKSVKKQHNHRKSIQNRDDEDKPEESGINKYCKCQEAFCSCCREFAVDVVNLNGPGCATLMYLDGDKMSVSLSFGKRVITNRTLSNRKPSPVCMPLPGGISKFCGRVYNIARAGEEFRACLGLELQAKKAVEAAVRVSCFKFGPRGVTSEPADPLPLVPQSEKDDDDDDDDDDEYDEDIEDDDAFGIGIDDDDDDDDDDDNDDDGGLELVKEADGVSDDYAGFPGLEDSFFDELFSSGSSSKKKSNKIKKKQAPVSTTTTTTRRPRPPRPNRRPSTRTTTPRPIRTTTVKIRPVNRRPTRRPTRRPANGSRRTTTTERAATVLSTTTTTTMPVPSTIEQMQTTESDQIKNVNEQVSEIANLVVQNQEPMAMVTTDKNVLSFDDPTLEMSLAHVTGQLSSLQVTPLLPNDIKESDMPSKKQEEMNYEKVETITAKAPSTASFTVTTEESINDNLIQIVQSLDSESEEVMPPKNNLATDESRGDYFNRGFHNQRPNNPKKKNRNQDFALADIDILDLTQIGESIGDQIGVFGGGKKKKNHNNNQHKVRNGKGDDNDYDDIFDTLSDTLIMRKSDNGNKVRKDRRRQNKMMRGEW